jgi:beta-glucanase (GH16 family)
LNTYKLVFEENFNVDGEPNPKIWNHEIGEKWSNNESQCYVSDINHCYISNSKLHLVATYEEGEHCPYKSARLNTFGKYHFQYGKFVINAKMPKGRGAWPALWFIGTSKKERMPWPLCGEIDLVEYAGNRCSEVTCAVHTQTYNHKINTHKGSKTQLIDASDAFHDYSLEWTKKHLLFFVDDTEVMRVEKQLDDTEKEWPFDKPYFFIINLAVGGWYGGEIAQEDLPYHFEISSIKYYELNETI